MAHSLPGLVRRALAATPQPAAPIRCEGASVALLDESAWRGKVFLGGWTAGGGGDIAPYPF